MVRQHPARGLWEARYVGADGRKHSLYAKTRREAQERMRQALLEADHGIAPVGHRLTVAAYLDDWLATSVRVRCRPRTIESYEETVARYIAPAIGRYPLARLSPEHVGGMLADLTRRGLSPTTVRYAHAVLRIALGRALKQGKVLRNVAQLVDAPAKASRDFRPLSADEAARFLGSVEGDRLEALYVVAIATGCRQGELLALRWSDVDLEAGTFVIRHTLERNTRKLAEPKTERARRGVRLGAEALASLRAHRTRQLEERLAAGRKWTDGDYVFTSGIGTTLDSRNVTRRFQHLLAAAGLPSMPFHGLRHAFATLLIESGEDLGVVSRILGHADLRTTADVYAHLTARMSERAAARMDAIIRRRREAAG
jgi:integrase